MFARNRGMQFRSWLHLRIRGSTLKVSKTRKQIVKPWILPKNERMNSTLLLWYLSSTCFHLFSGRNWRHQKTFRNLLTFRYVQLYILNTNIVGTFLRMLRILVHEEAGSDGARFQKPVTLIVFQYVPTHIGAFWQNIVRWQFRVNFLHIANIWHKANEALF